MPEQLAATVPDEPPRGSVVIDSKGLAWQHLGGGLVFGPSGGGGEGWSCACPPHGEPRSTNWPYLLAYAGPVTLVHRGEEKAGV